MNKQKALVGAAVLTALLGLAGCGMAATTGSTPGAEATMATTTPMPAMPESTSGMTSMIHIESGAYRDAAPVEAGSIVAVMNMDTAEYTLTADDGSSFSVKVPAGAMATFKAPNKPGSYPFHDGRNAGMHGALVVR